MSTPEIKIMKKGRLVLWFLLFSLLVPGSAWTQDTAPRPGAATPAPIAGSYMVPEFPLPDRVTLCGVPFPLQNRNVYESLDLEFTIAVQGQAQVQLWLKRAGRYFPYIEKRLIEEGLPNDLKYLAVAESDLRPHVYSPAKALGAWQFMPATGRRYGLERNKYFDERLNFEQSTEAAIKYLKDLHSEFGDWLLAMASYNCGEGRMRGEIEEQRVKEYFRLNLPQETERYIFRIAAIKIILENPRKYGFYVAPERIYKPLLTDKVNVSISAPIHITDAAQGIGTDYKVIKELNPQIQGRYLPKGAYTIDVPLGKGRQMLAYLNRVPKAAPATPNNKTSNNNQAKSAAKAKKYYTVKNGDTLHKISRDTGVSIDQIKRLNKMSGNQIRIGEKLLISD